MRDSPNHLRILVPVIDKTEISQEQHRCPLEFSPIGSPHAWRPNQAGDMFQGAGPDLVWGAHPASLGRSLWTGPAHRPGAFEVWVSDYLPGRSESIFTGGRLVETTKVRRQGLALSIAGQFDDHSIPPDLADLAVGLAMLDQSAIMAEDGDPDHQALSDHEFRFAGMRDRHRVLVKGADVEDPIGLEDQDVTIVKARPVETDRYPSTNHRVLPSHDFDPNGPAVPDIYYPVHGNLNHAELRPHAWYQKIV